MVSSPSARCCQPASSAFSLQSSSLSLQSSCPAPLPPTDAPRPTTYILHSLPPTLHLMPYKEAYSPNPMLPPDRFALSALQRNTEFPTPDAGDDVSGVLALPTPGAAGRGAGPAARAARCLRHRVGAPARCVSLGSCRPPPPPRVPRAARVLARRRRLPAALVVSWAPATSQEPGAGRRCALPRWRRERGLCFRGVAGCWALPPPPRPSLVRPLPYICSCLSRVCVCVCMHEL